MRMNTKTLIQQKLSVYLRLMRVDKPIGTLLLLWPTWVALWIAAEGRPDGLLVAVFTIGTFLMRSAGCVMNDCLDKHFDGKVERTKNRPFPKGEVTQKEATRLIIVLCVLACLCLIPLNNYARLLSLLALFLALTYPLMKRYFCLPQLYLGCAFSFGVPMAFAATQNHIPFLAWVIYLAGICWTLAYDTFYAIADKPDDLVLGIKTSAITFGDWDVEMCMLFYGLFDLLLLYIGWQIGATWFYWMAWYLMIFWQWQHYLRAQSRSRDACFAVFLDNNKIGWLWFSAILAHYAAL